MEEVKQLFDNVETLENCPFCGSEAQLWEYDNGGSYKKGVCCSNEDCVLDNPGSAFEKETKREAIEAWNTRHTPEVIWTEELEREADKLKEVLWPTPEAIKGIEWVGECDRCYGAKKFREASKPPYIATDCPKCNGTGTITREATMEEVGVVFGKVLRDGNIFMKFSSYDIRKQLLSEALKVNSGTLRLKED